MTLRDAGHPPAEAGPGLAGKLHFSLQGWSRTYGITLELQDSLDTCNAGVLIDDFLADLPPDEANTSITRSISLFVDGVRRIEARMCGGDVSMALRG